MFAIAAGYAAIDKKSWTGGSQQFTLEQCALRIDQGVDVVEVKMASAPIKKPMISVEVPEKNRRQPARPQQSTPKKMPHSQKPSVATPNQTSDILDDVSFLRLPEVKAVTGLSKTSIYDLIREKSFPAPVRLGPRAVAWVKSEIRQWAVQRVHASRSAA